MKRKILTVILIPVIAAGTVLGITVFKTIKMQKEFQKQLRVTMTEERMTEEVLTKITEASSAVEKPEDRSVTKVSVTEQSQKEAEDHMETEAFQLDTYIDNRDFTHSLYIYDMDYIGKAIDFEKKDLQDFTEVIEQNTKIAEKFKPLLMEYCKRVFATYPEIELRPFYLNLQNLEVIECTEEELRKVSWDIYSYGCYVKSENRIYVLKEKEYEKGTWDYQVMFHELSHCLRDCQYTDENGNEIKIQFVGLNYYDTPNAEALNSLFAVSLFDYEERDIAYQLQSNAHKIMIECMDNYTLSDYVNHSLTYYAQQLDVWNQDDNRALTILSLMREQYEDYYDDSRENPQETYYPIYDYISEMYLKKYGKEGMSSEEKKALIDEMLEKLLFDVPEEYHIDHDYFYECI